MEKVYLVVDSKYQIDSIWKSDLIASDRASEIGGFTYPIRMDTPNGFSMIQPGEFYEDSFYRPMKCTSIDGEGDLEGVSLVDGETYIENCDHALPISEKEALNLVDLWKEGEKNVLIKRGLFSESEADEFINDWRTSTNKLTMRVISNEGN